MKPVVHIAGVDVKVGTQLRQRCSWCGAVLIDVNLANIAVPVGQDPDYPTWTVGGLVEVIDGAQWIVQHEDGAQLPANSCGVIDPAVTA